MLRARSIFIVARNSICKTVIAASLLGFGGFSHEAVAQESSPAPQIAKPGEVGASPPAAARPDSFPVNAEVSVAFGKPTENWTVVTEAAEHDFRDGLQAIERLYSQGMWPFMMQRFFQERCSDRLEPFGIMLAEVKDRQSRNTVFGVIGDFWVRKDPRALTDYAFANLKGEELNTLVSHVISSFIKSGDLTSAADCLAKMPDSTERRSCLDNLARAKADVDPNKAIAWANSLNSAKEKAAALSAMIPKIGENRGGEILKSLLGHLDLDFPYLQRQCIEGIVDSYNRSGDTRGVEEWMATLTVEDRIPAQLELVRENATEDLPKWTAYAAAIPSLKDSTIALMGIGAKLGANDPETGAKWGSALRDRQARNSATLSAIYSWSNIDPKAASAWARQLPNDATRDTALDVLMRALASLDLTEARQNADAIGDPAKRKAALAWLAKPEPRY